MSHFQPIRSEISVLQQLVKSVNKEMRRREADTLFGGFAVVLNRHKNNPLGGENIQNLSKIHTELTKHLHAWLTVVNNDQKIRNSEEEQVVLEINNIILAAYRACLKHVSNLESYSKVKYTNKLPDVEQKHTQNLKIIWTAIQGLIEILENGKHIDM